MDKVIFRLLRRINCVTDHFLLLVKGSKEALFLQLNIHDAVYSVSSSC